MTGGATYTLSLPKPWVIANNLAARDSLRVDWRPSGELNLSPLDIVEEQRTIISLDLDGLPKGALYDHLMGAYISGALEIIVQSERPFSRKVRSEVRRFLRSTRGFEIGEQSESSTLLVSLLNAGELPLQASLNRMYLLLSSLVRDIMDVLSGGDEEMISDHEEREREVDGLQYLIARQVGSMLDSSNIVKSLALTRKQGVEHANLARSLERMMDHANQMAKMTLETNPRPNIDPVELPLVALPIWMESIKSLMINLRIRDSHEIEVARNSLKDAQLELERHEEGLWTGKRKATPLLFEDRISESTRRLCAYARDFGEILLNMMAYDSIQRS
ncbi:MAG: phosphate uptake regulator PhoU [Candidatus Thermoplasmatota archaeon]|nr:phosphate uptake regulator PhoU [Candidatus Thermoplasmatota archaeon]MEE2625272.1 phosphate uptake regulator PhoU [Candidatus Thermoplasmatota archaeon]